MGCGKYYFHTFPARENKKILWPTVTSKLDEGKVTLALPEAAAGKLRARETRLVARSLLANHAFTILSRPWATFFVAFRVSTTSGACCTMKS